MSKMSKEEKKELKEQARVQQIERVVNYNRVVAIELANRSKEKKPNKDAFICLQNVNKIYDNLVQAVFDFSLDIKKNEFIVLVGPSGCGKSTTLRMIAGLEEITAGNLFIDGVYANVLPPKDRDISMVFQSYALYPHMSVYDNMAFAMQIRPYFIPQFDEDGKPIMGIDEETVKSLNKQIADLDKQINNVNSYKYDGKGHEEVIAQLTTLKSSLEKQLSIAQSTPVQVKQLRKYKKTEIDEFVAEAAKILQIEEYLDRKPRALSGGQRQRVALGRAIVKKAKLFLMDEPLSNLDAKLRVSMRSEIKRIHKSIGATTIYVTHDQTEAMTMADRIVIMNKGYIQQIGTPEEIYNKPSNVFVATFIGSPAMNIYDAKLENDAIVFANNEKLPVPTDVTKKVEEQIKAKVKAVDDFEANGLNEELQRQVNINKETLILEMKTKKAGGGAVGKPDPLDNIVLTDEEKHVCQRIYERKLEELSAKRTKYKEMIKNKSFDIKFGIRPEHVYIKGASLEKDVVPSDSVKLKIAISELLGNEYFLHADFAGKDFILKTTSYNPVKEGETAEILIDLNKIHIFDSVDDMIIY